MRENILISAIAPAYKIGKYWKGFLENTIELDNIDDVEIVIVHNEPDEEEKKIFVEYQKRNPNLYQYIEVPLEPVSVSANRAIQNAKGKYIAVWNVDDYRTPESLRLQFETLQKSQAAAITYGDMIDVKKYGSTEGKKLFHPEKEKYKGEFLRGMYGGSYPMWKKEVHNVIGYFDEQLKSGADFDLWVRINRCYGAVKTNSLMGYRLNEGKGLSTSNYLQPLERTVIELRYAIFDKIDFLLIFKAIKNYRIFKIKEGSQWVHVSQYFPAYWYYWISHLYLIILGFIRFMFKLSKILLQKLFKILLKENCSIFIIRF